MNSLVSPQNSILAKSLVTSICALTLLALSGCEAMIEVPLQATYKSSLKADKREEKERTQREIKEGFEEYQKLIQKQQAGTVTSYELIKIGRMSMLGDVGVLLEKAHRNPKEMYNQYLQASVRQGNRRAAIEIAHNQIVDSFTASSFRHNNYLSDNVFIENPAQLQEGLTSAKDLAKRTCTVFPIDEKYIYEYDGSLRTFGGNNLNGIDDYKNSYTVSYPNIIRDVRVLNLYDYLNCYNYDYREGADKDKPKSRGIEALEVFKYERDDDDWYFTDPNKLMHYYVLSRLTDETEYRPLLKEKMENHSTPNLIQKADKLYDAYVNEFGKPQ